VLVPALSKALREQGADDIVIICGGVIPQQDYEFLRNAGASAIFGPGTNIPECAAEVLSIVREKRAQAA
jgi:methylmalonyl-CoA mutase